MAESTPMAKYTAEVLGTAALVLSVGCNVLAPTPFNVISIASTLMVFIYALGGISGGHFNPAVSLAVTLAVPSFGWDQFGIYFACQLLGGTIGAFSYVALFGKSFNLAPAAGYSWMEAFGAEVLYTFMLAFVVLNVACAAKSQKNEYFGLAIAFTVVAGGYGAGKISGGCFNPAVAFGIDISSAWLGFGHCAHYIIAELIGGALAYGLYRAVRPEEFGGSSEAGLMQKLLSEFLGTFFLVLTVGLNVASGASQAAVFSIASSLMCMIYALGNVSGGHFNPAVTVAILASGRDKISGGDAGAYIFTQILGGIAAGLTYGGLMGTVSISQPAGKFGWADVAGAEFFFTFVLSYVVLCVATTRSALAHFFALAIGFCVVVGGYSIGGVSGGHLNPAVSIGIDASSAALKHTAFYKSMIYAGIQLVGGLAASGVFMVTHANEFAGKAAPAAAPTPAPKVSAPKSAAAKV